MKGTKVTLTHEASGSRIDSVIVDAAPSGAWVDLPGGVTVYEGEGWKIERG